MCVLLNSSNVSSNTKAVSQSETLVIGSGPLPARAPPEKKMATAQPPKVASQPSSVSSATAAVVSQPQPIKAPTPAPVPAPVPPPAKPVTSSSSLPKLTQPMPLASRPPLANVARGVAAAFLELDDDDTETTARKTSTSISTIGTTLLSSIPQNSTMAKKVEPSRSTASKPPEPVPPPVTAATTSANKLATTKSDFMMGLSGMSYSDIVLAAQMQKTVGGLSYEKGRTAEGNRPSYSSRRPRQPTDSKGRKKLEIGRNVM